MITAVRTLGWTSSTDGCSVCRILRSLPVADGLDASRRRRVFREREMGPGAVIVGEVVGERAPQMPLVEDDHVVETLAPDRTDHALDVGILPRTGWRGDHLSNPHRGDPMAERITIDGVAIPQEPARGGVIGEGLNDLLGRPGSRGMLGDPEMDDAPTVVRQQHQDEQHAAGQGRHREEVQRDRCGQVIPEEGVPRL
jgi:hypothetical protein